MDEELRNNLNYLLIAVTTFMIGCATALVPQLMADPPMAINWNIVVGVGITALLGTLGTRKLPRGGSAGLARQVKELQEAGVSRDEMKVIPDARKIEQHQAHESDP